VLVENICMYDSAAQAECQTKKIKDWLLALLRYALTLHDADKSAVLLIAEETDKLGSRAEDRSAFKFFRQTSTDLCNAIADKDDPNRATTLRSHLGRIGDHRLRRAFEAAVEFGDTCRIVSGTSKIRERRRQDLWKGLRPSRDD